MPRYLVERSFPAELDLLRAGQADTRLDRGRHRMGAQIGALAAQRFPD